MRDPRFSSLLTRDSRGSSACRDIQALCDLANPSPTAHRQNSLGRGLCDRLPFFDAPPARRLHFFSCYTLVFFFPAGMVSASHCGRVCLLRSFCFVYVLCRFPCISFFLSNVSLVNQRSAVALLWYFHQFFSHLPSLAFQLTFAEAPASFPQI